MRLSSLRWVVALGLFAAWVGPLAVSVRADPPGLEARVAALGPAREGERELYGQLAGALEIAESSSAEGDSARAERHRDLALALVRSLEARRRVAELRARLEERRRVHDAATARLTAARAAVSQAGQDATRLGAP